MSQSHRLLHSLAILNVNSNTLGHDYYEYIVSLIRSVIPTDFTQPLLSKTIHDCIVETYGLTIPLHVIEAAVHRMIKRGTVTVTDRKFYITNNYQSVDVSDLRNSTEEKIILLVSRLKDFFHTHNLTCSNEDIRIHLEEFVDIFALNFLETKQQKKYFNVNDATYSKHIYYIAKFIHLQKDHDNGCIGLIDTFVKGRMIANAFTCEDLNEISRKFSNTTFYIDTPLVLGAIGLDYDDRCQKSLELINMIKKLDGKVFIFDQTLDEISYIIRGIIKNYSSPVYPSSAHRTALSKKMSISDLKMLLERVDKKILGTGIKIRPRINVHDNRKSLIDESLLEAEIRETVGQINDHAIKHDTYCIRDIHILRRDTKPKHIEDAIAVFVTSNTKLATASYNFALINIPETKASAVVTDFYLTNRCFLKLPLDTSSISRIELYSICLSVLRPSDAMWVKYVRELNKLHDDDYIDQDLYMHMRLHTEETENELLDIVYEHGGHFSQNDIIELTERLRNKFTKDIELERDNLAAKVNTITSNIDKTAKRIARIVISALSIITLVLLSITAYTYFTSQQSNTNNFITYMSATGNFLLLVFTAFGVSVTSLLLTVRNKTVEWIKIKLQS